MPMVGGVPKATWCPRRMGGLALLYCERQMPVYEYLCEKGHTFDAMQRMADDPLTVCEVCGRPVRRVLQPVAVHFKGSGFYNTDYGTRKRQRENQAHESATKADSKSKSESSSSTDGGSASKGSEGSASPSKDSAKADKPATKEKATPAKSGK